MARKIIIGVMGPGAKAGPEDKKYAFELGSLIAKEGWVLLSGGRNEGVMAAVNSGAAAAGGLSVGILAAENADNLAEGVSIPIITGMGSARNNINVLSSNVVISCGMGLGTASEIALALKAGKNCILLSTSSAANDFFNEIGGEKVYHASSPEQAIEICRSILNKSS